MLITEGITMAVEIRERFIKSPGFLLEEPDRRVACIAQKPSNTA
jgi:hypothetical protein